jgi:nitrite reductase/ring-hydroxylating ferredoxin subunit
MAEASGAAPESVVVDVSDLAPGATRPVECGRRKALLCNVGGAFYAVAERCTHAAFSLAEGCLEGPHLECPLHGALFDVRDGSPVRRPASKPLATYPVEVDGTRVEVRFE